MEKIYQQIIKGGMVVGPGGINNADLGIRDGKIARVASNLRSDEAREVIDGTGMYILPGLFDVHVHPVYVDSIADCSALGAHGGITTMIHYAYSKPGTGLAETVQRFIEEGWETSHTDFAIHGAMFDAKNQIDDEFSNAPVGSPSSETILPVTYQRGVNEGRLDLYTLIRALSEMPAKIFGLYPQKGVLQEGSDADLVIFDPKKRETIRQATQHSNAPYSLYEGFECLGSPTLVMQRGEIIIEGGELKSKKGRGQFLRTKTSGD